MPDWSNGWLAKCWNGWLAKGSNNKLAKSSNTQSIICSYVHIWVGQIWAYKHVSIWAYVPPPHTVSLC
jgi:hypothetical protein